MEQPVISARLSTGELTGRILQMAQSGVYRESIFEAFQPLASKRCIRLAIAQAKQFGLYSVPAMRDPELGTYYQVDGAKVKSYEQAAAALTVGPGEDLAARLVESTRVVRTMLAVAGIGGILLFGLGAFHLLQGHTALGRELWSGALLAGGIWLVQRSIAGRLL